jgi:hypothetical protein
MQSLASNINNPTDPRYTQLTSSQNISAVSANIQAAVNTQLGIQIPPQNPIDIEQFLRNTYFDNFINPYATVDQMNQETVQRAVNIIIPKVKLNQYYTGKIGYLPVPPPLPKNMSAYGLKPAGEIYRGI